MNYVFFLLFQSLLFLSKNGMKNHTIEDRRFKNVIFSDVLVHVLLISLTLQITLLQLVPFSVLKVLRVMLQMILVL